MKRALAAALVLLACGCRKPKEENPAPQFSVVAPGAPAVTATASATAEAPNAPTAEPPLDDGGAIGLGNIGTIGGGFGRDAGSHSPRVVTGSTTVNGRLPPEVVQRIVRRNMGRFKYCYQQGLVRDPSLSGKVAVKFVIDTKGEVTTATRDASTTLTDAAVVACITRAFQSLSFPEPEGGIVVVTYPIVFQPGE